VTTAVKPAAIVAATAWPPPRAFMAEQPTSTAHFDALSALLPITLANREILFVSGASFSTPDPLEHDAATASHIWEPSVVRTFLKEISRVKASERCVLVFVTGRTGQQIAQTAAPFLGWGMADHGRSRSSNVRSMTLLHAADDGATCTPILRGRGTPARTMFDGQMDVILPSAEFVDRRSIGAFIEFFGAPAVRTHELRVNAAGYLI